MSQPQHNVLVLLELPAEVVLPMLGEGKEPVDFQTPHGVFRAKVGGKRLECFRRNQTCVACGKKGTVFRLERQTHQTWQREFTAHLNLYHITEHGSYVLLTKDHVIPLSGGGKDSQDNLATCCSPCNNRKGNNQKVWIVSHNEPSAPKAIQLEYVKAPTKAHALAIYAVIARSKGWNNAMDAKELRTIN